MKNFNNFLNEMSYEDIFKRNNKQTFIDKAVTGELITSDGKKLPKIKKDDDLIIVLQSSDDYGSIKTELQAALKSSLSIAISKIDKAANGFSIGGGSKEPTGAQWEEIICVAYNMKSGKLTKPQAMKKAGVESSWKSSFDSYLDIGHQIVESSFGNPSKIMEHYGSGTASLTKEWDQYFKQVTGKSANSSTKTPKTDMYIGKQHISLKKYGGSQLMSGGQAETLATLAFAYDNIPEKIKTKSFDNAWKKLSSSIETDFVRVKLPSGGSIGSIKKDIKAGKKSTLIQTVKDGLQNNDIMTTSLRSMLETPEVNQAVVREAMTGENKFADSLPISTHMMKFGSNGVGEYVPINNKLVSHYAKNTRFNISFKSSGQGGSSWTAMKAIYKESVDDILGDMLIEAYEETETDILVEGIISNSIVSFLKRMITKIWEKIKAFLIKGMNFVLQLLGLQMHASSPSIAI